jgi:hypothetical protein
MGRKTGGPTALLTCPTCARVFLGLPLLRKGMSAHRCAFPILTHRRHGRVLGKRRVSTCKQ